MTQAPSPPPSAPPPSAGASWYARAPEFDPESGATGSQQKVVAVGGGRPGSGHTVLSVNLGVYLAQLGRRVLLVDADAVCPALHNVLGIDLVESPASSEPGDEDELVTVPTEVPGLSLLPQAYAHGTTVPIRPGRKPRWLNQLRRADFEYIIIDLGAGTAPASLDLFLNADVGICVTSPDPPAVEGTYRFLRALFQRQVRRSYLKDRYRARQVERALAELAPLPFPLAALRALGRYDGKMAEGAAQELGLVRPYLVTNSTRMRPEMELGRAMSDMAGRYLGVFCDDLGYIEQDDAVLLSVLRRRPLLLENPSSKSGRNLERIARRVAAVAAARATASRPAPWREEGERSLYDVLWTHPGSSDEELRRAYKRQRDIFQQNSLPLVSLLSRSDLETELLRLDEAQKTLLDPIRRRAYDLSFFPEKAKPDESVPPELSEAQLLEQAALRNELAREIHGETEFTGTLLRRVRESQGIELEDISRKTRIAVSHLAAIEAEDFDQLPAEVYTRGFVSQMAGLLGLDKTQATRSYLRRYRALRKAALGDRA